MNSRSGPSMHRALCIAGKNLIATNVLQRVREEFPHIDLCVVPNRTDTGEDGWQPSLIRTARLMNVPIIGLPEAEGRSDLTFLSLEYDRIVRPERFSSQKLFNLHFSKLPRYRGVLTSALPILHGARSTGVTLHLIDHGIDTGDIIDAASVRIQSDWNCRQLYDALMKEGTELAMKWMGMLLDEAANISARRQAGRQATYFSRNAIDYSNMQINCRQTAFQAYRQVKALAFRAYQLPLLGEIRIANATVSTRRSTSAPGTIITRDRHASTVATLDHDLVLWHDQLDAMLAACRDGDLATAKGLIRNITHIDDEDEEGTTPLLASLQQPDAGLARYFVSKGADPDRLTRNRIPVRSLSEARGIKL
ncbi:formyltransferase family protein [Uliginosibacterium paludis]|uniref:Formyltransferase family protein n=1 Tax=Uliginosibacterium paludis TaxID=1615952 RepID=A0ABV2CKP9_9RHOO